jgi:hypothetical protein
MEGCEVGMVPLGIWLESAWSPPGVHLEFGWTGIHADLGESGRNGRNLVGIWWE